MKPEEKITLLKQAWKEVFGVDEVADDADFFEEGGDSIMAVQLSSWLVQKGVKLDLGKIFYTPVLSDMAETLEETDAMFVPEELLTKDIMQKKLDEVMQEPSSPQGDDDQQICDPETMEQEGTAPDQQICDPETMQPAGAAPDQQICDPETMQPAGAAPDQQLCDPETMQPSAAAFDQQICDLRSGDDEALRSRIRPAALRSGDDEALRSCIRPAALRSGDDEALRCGTQSADLRSGGRKRTSASGVWEHDFAEDDGSYAEAHDCAAADRTSDDGDHGRYDCTACRPARQTAYEEEYARSVFPSSCGSREKQAVYAAASG